MKVFNFHIPLPFVFLFFIEFTILMASVYGGVYLRFGSVSWQPEFGALTSLPAKAAFYALIMMISLIAMGLYQAKSQTGKLLLPGIFLRVAISLLLGVIALTLLYYLVPSLYIGRGVNAYTLMITIVTCSLLRFIFFRTVSRKFLRRKVLVYGAGERASSLLGTIDGSNTSRSLHSGGYQIHGFVIVDGEENKVPSEYTIQPLEDICGYCKAYGIDEVVIAVSDRRGKVPVDALLDCKMANINIIDFVSLQERENGMLCLEMLQPSWLLFSDGCGSGDFRSFLSRIFDILGSLAILIAMFPVMVLTALLISLESGFKGPIFYRQQRVGLNDKPFGLFKFRSMQTDAEKNGKAVWAKVNDTRITRVGSVIRKFRIDELPQLLNILRGDMSIVGPRPERPEFVENLKKTIPFYHLRHRVKPGLAGWAQIKYPYGASEDDAYKKLQYDLYYVKNNSVLMDLFVLLQTVEVVLLGEGVR